MKKIFLTTALVLSVVFLFAEEITINGHVVGANGLQIRLFTYADQISYQKVMIQETRIDENGTFSMSIDAKNTICTFLSIDLYWSACLYLEPGKNYFLDLDSADYKMKDEKVFNFYDERRIFFRVNHDHPRDLNNRIFNFNNVYSDFVVRNFNSFGSSSSKRLIEDFKTECLSRYVDREDDEYIRAYITYRIASLELSLNLKSERTIFTSYISGEDIYWENDEYMAFFNQFYNKYFQTSSLLDERKLIDMVNNEATLFALLDSMGVDSTLRNERIREMVLIKAMGEAYVPYSDYNPTNVLGLLKQMSQQSKFDEHRKAALTMMKKITYLTKGQPAPNFKAKNVEDSVYTSENFRGKWIYLGFWASWSDPCIAEMEAMRKLYPEYKDSIEFVMISVDQEFLDYFYHMKDNSYPWPVLHYDKQISLLEAYYAKVLPLFVMIDPQGNIFKYPALKPSDGVENMFYYICNRNNLPTDYSRVGKW